MRNFNHKFYDKTPKHPKPVGYLPEYNCKGIFLSFSKLGG